jgi:hypothetical protein
MFFMPRIYPDPFPLDFSHSSSEDDRLRRKDEASHLAPRHRYKLKKSAYIRLIRIICGFLPPPTFNPSRAFQRSRGLPRHRSWRNWVRSDYNPICEWKLFSSSVHPRHPWVPPRPPSPPSSIQTQRIRVYPRHPYHLRFPAPTYLQFIPCFSVLEETSPSPEMGILPRQRGRRLEPNGINPDAERLLNLF